MLVSTGHDAPLLPSLAILEQQSLSTEMTESGGFSKKVHVVVKNSPFRVRLAIAHANLASSPPLAETFSSYLLGSSIAISLLSFDCKLLYDTDAEQEVDYVRVQPFQFKVESVKRDATHVDIEVRLKVLSSQHEDMCFCVQFFAVDPVTQNALPNLSCKSAPIKVISKPEQLKERAARKPTTNERIVQHLRRIRAEQAKHTSMVNHLVAGASSSHGASLSLHPRVASPASALPRASPGGEGGDRHHLLHAAPSMQPRPSSAAPPTAAPPTATATMDAPAQPPSMSAPLPPPVTTSGLTASTPPADVGEALRSLIRAYRSTPKDERASKIKVALEDTSAPRRAQLLELRDLLVSEGLPAPVGSTGDMGALHHHDPGGLECNCPDCPWRKELDRIELFYKDVFSLGS